jgi:glycosyltransferase involved in cell wall biosynthesis
MNRPAVTFLVHGGPDSIEAVRLRGLSQRVPANAIQFLFRTKDKRATWSAWSKAIRRNRPDLLYVLNTAIPGAPIASWSQFFRGIPYVLDTGDVIFEMARRSGIGAGWRLPMLWTVEQLAWRRAHRIVVRGTRHKEYLEKLGLRAALVRDGYASQQHVPEERLSELRTKLGLQGKLVIGLMGSLVWSPRLQICYGWDLIRALPSLTDLPISVVIIGDGNGRAWLESEANRLGVGGLITFTGRMPYPDVPAYMRLLDIALSTQTNNLPGQVRTTGKVPEYMAAGCFILASKVGEAELLLPPEMVIPFNGEVDREYPARLAGRIREVLANPELLALRKSLPERAAKTCSYEVLSLEWLNVINQSLIELGRPKLPTIEPIN